MKIENVSITLHSGRKVISDVSFAVNPGDKLAIIGEEGNGKSTLLKAILHDGALEYIRFSGKIHRAGEKLAMLEQSIDVKWLDHSVLDYLLRHDPAAEPDYDILSGVQAELSRFQLPEGLLDDERTVRTLSGGEKVKLQLIKVLQGDPDILLLDEPTNDIDLPTLKWLEQFVIGERRAVVFISHDIVFLENAATRILHLENVKGKREERYTMVSMGYARYAKTRAEQFDRQVGLHRSEQRLFKKQLEELNDQKNAVRSAQIHTKDSAARRVLNKKMKNVLAVKDRLEAEDKTDMPHREEAMNIAFEAVSLPPSKRIIDLTLDTLSIGERILSRDIHLQVFGGQKVVLIGKNGAGKTTLMKKVIEHLREDPTLKVGYFPQYYDEEFKPDDTALTYLNRFTDDLVLAQVQLGGIRFTREEMDAPVRTLSGGQKAKLILSKLVLSGCNVILADEPTRNLSPLSGPVLHDMFRAFGGSMFIISHDRRFIETVADEVYELTEHGLQRRYDWK